ncbi:MAG: phage head-tail connector protein [Erythrobacter sp.]
MPSDIVVPADLGGLALSELKTWLGITRSQEDALLVDFLEASVSQCQAYIGQSPLDVTVEEYLSPDQEASLIQSRPAKEIQSVQLLDHNGNRNPMADDTYEIEIDENGAAHFKILKKLDGRAIVVRLRVGIAPKWETLPATLAQGIIRLAGHLYRYRDRNEVDKMPPSAINLWQIWRRPRLL